MMVSGQDPSKFLVAQLFLNTSGNYTTVYLGPFYRPATRFTVKLLVNQNKERTFKTKKKLSSPSYSLQYTPLVQQTALTQPLTFQS